MELNIWIAFWAGLASFISPCCLPLYPSYISYITGISVNQLKSKDAAKEVRMRMILHTLFFILGFSVVFFSLGLGAGLLGETFKDYQNFIRQMSAILIIVMGLFLAGIFQPKWLMKERKLQIKSRPAGYLGTLVIGIGFAAGWSPCIGPILAAIIGLAVSDPSTWLGMITAYTIGFAVPFFVLAFFLGSTKWILKYSARLMKIGGYLMILMGVLLYTNELTKITIWLNQITPDWLKF